MSGKRILDLIILASVGKAVLQHHLRIRAHQFNVYEKSSTVLKSVRGVRNNFGVGVTGVPNIKQGGDSAGQAAQGRGDVVKTAGGAQEQSTPLEKVEQPLPTLMGNEATALSGKLETHDDLFYLRSARSSPLSATLPRIKTLDSKAKSLGLGGIGLGKTAKLMEGINLEELKQEKEILVNETRGGVPEYGRQIKVQKSEVTPSKTTVHTQEKFKPEINSDVVNSSESIILDNIDTQRSELKLEQSEETQIDKSRLARENDQDTFNVGMEGTTIATVEPEEQNPNFTIPTTEETKESAAVIDNLAGGVGEQVIFTLSPTFTRGEKG